MRFVTLRLNGRPLYMLLWFVWNCAIVALICVRAGTGNALNSASGFYWMAVLWFSGLALCCALVASVATKKSGRAWLLAEYHDDKGEQIGLLSCAIVRAAPLVALIVLVEVWILP
jgi:hypothetical protein